MGATERGALFELRWWSVDDIVAATTCTSSPLISVFICAA
jgi:hypothetical protein